MRRAALVTALLVAASAPADADRAAHGINGRIALPDGAGAPGVTVELVAQTGAYEFGRLALGGRHYPEPIARAATDAEGRYAFETVEPGMWHLSVAPQGYRPMEFYFLPLVRDRRVPTLELVPESAVEIRVRDAAGQPLAGAHVRAEPPPSDSRGFGRPDAWRPAYRQAFTDESGRASLGRGSGEALTVYAFAEGHLEASKTGVEASSVELRLEAGTARQLKVGRVSGEPAAEALVRLGERRWPAGTTDADGRIELFLPADGRSRAHVIGAEGSRGEGWLEPAAVAADEPLTVTLLPPERRSGRILDARTREPIPRAYAWVGGRPADAVVADADGGYALDVPRSESGVWIWGAAEGYVKDVVRFEADAETAAGSGPQAPTLALQPAIRASGVVVDERGEPVPEAAVAVSISPSARGRSVAWRASTNLEPAVSDARGRFEVGDLHPDVSYVVRATKPGFAGAEIELPKPSADAVSGLTIVLEQGRIATGTVVDEGGAPIAGARIALEKRSRSSSLRRVVLEQRMGGRPSIDGFTHEDGRFSIPDLAAGLYELEATATGYAPAAPTSVEIAEAGVTDLGELTLEPGVAIEGRVTDRRGSALEGASVFATESMSEVVFRMVVADDDAAPAAISDASGFFTVPDRRRGEVVDLRVELSGYAAGRIAAVEAPTGRPLEVRLDRASTVSGQVVDGGGRPIAGANVWVQSKVSMGPVTTSRTGGRARTGDDGRFVIENVEPGEISLSAEAGGYRDTSIGSLVVEPEQDLDDVRVVLEPGATIVGRVTDGYGKPVADAIVLLAEGGTLFSGIRTSGVTGSDGRFELEGVAPGRQSVTARHDDFQPAVREIDVQLGINTLDLVFEGGATVSGRVVDESGAPVPGAEIELASFVVSTFNTGQTTVTDTSGAFTLPGVSEGTFTLHARKEGFAEAVVADLEVGGGDVTGLEIRLAPGAAIVGSLIGLEPAELAEVQILAIALPRTVFMGRVERDGSYRIDDVGPGDYTVRAQVGMGARGAQETVVVNPGDTELRVDLEFTSGLRLSGVVLRRGEPIAGVMVMASGVDVASSSGGTTTNEGRFELRGLEPGRHVLTVSNYGAGLQHREEIDLQSDREVILRVEAARVAGTVRDATDGAPLAGAEVRLEALEATQALDGPPLYGLATTDSAGFFRLAEVSTGDHRLVARKEGYAPTETLLTVIDGVDQEALEILLEPTAGLRVFVTLPTGTPATEFFAAALDPTGRALVSGIYSAGPEGALLSIPPGEWELLVSTRDSAVASARVSLPSEPIAIPLAPQARLRVRVPELAGDPALALARVTRPSGEPFRGLQWTWTRAEWPLSDGKGEIPGLGPGTWLIAVDTPDGRSWRGQVSLGPEDNPELVLD